MHSDGAKLYLLGTEHPNSGKVRFKNVKAWPNWITLLASMSIVVLVECWSIFHAVHRSGQIG